MLLLIDNYDSFVYNIFHCIDYPAKEIIVARNDQLNLEDIERYNIDGIIISPGPMGPNEAGISNDVIKTFGHYIPILGICLGHQCIGYVFNCKVEKYYNPTHGKKSKVYLDNSQIYEGLGPMIEAGRYHSLYISGEDFNWNALKVNARLEDGTIMGVEHIDRPIFGVQFHPESILTGASGKIILNNFVKIITRYCRRAI